jgi:adenylate kinase
MTPQTFLIYGRSGCGKGTQAKLLIDYIQKKDPKNRLIYIETGSKLREFSLEANVTSKMTAEMMDKGGLIPSFIPIWIWTNTFVRTHDGTEHIVLDGVCRRVYEAPVLDDALKFYKREKPTLIIIDVSREWAIERLMGRGRSDDTKEDIEARMDWFEQNTLPTIEYFKKDPYYNVVTINGEQTIEDVHKEVMTKLGLE